MSMLAPSIPTASSRSPPNLNGGGAIMKSTASACMLPRTKGVVTTLSVDAPLTLMTVSLVWCGVSWSGPTASSPISLKKPPVSIIRYFCMPLSWTGTNTRPLWPIFMSTLVNIVNGGQSSPSACALQRSDRIASTKPNLPMHAPGSTALILQGDATLCSCPVRVSLTAPDGFAVAGQAQARPLLGDGAHDVLVHADEASPFALGFGRKLVGRVEPDLGAEPAFGRGEVEIVDRRVLDDGDVARRIHAGGDRPHDVFPVPRVDVVVHHDHPFGVHELAQIRPHLHHHALGVAGIGFLHRHHGDAIRAALGRQPEIHDLWELLLQQGHEDFVECFAEH